MAQGPEDPELVEDQNQPAQRRGHPHRPGEAAQQRARILGDQWQLGDASAREQQAQDRGQDIHAGIQHQAEVAGQEQGAGQHLGQRHVAERVGQGRQREYRHAQPGGIAYQPSGERGGGRVDGPAAGVPEQPQHQQHRQQGQCEQVDAVVIGVAQEQETQQVQQVQAGRHVGPVAKYLVDARRQQAQHRHQRQEQRELMQDDRRVRLHEQHAGRGQQDPGSKRALQDAHGRLHFRLGVGESATAPAQPEQQRQQGQGRHRLEARTQVVGVAVVADEFRLGHQPGAQRVVGGVTLSPGLRAPQRRCVDARQAAVVVGDGGGDRLLSGIDAGLDGIGAAAELDLFVDRWRDGLFGRRQVGLHLDDPRGQRLRQRVGLRGGRGQRPGGFAPADFGRIEQRLLGGLLQIVAPGGHLPLEETPMALDALQPGDREQLEFLVLEQRALFAD